MELMIGAMMESTVAISAAAHLAAGLGCFKFIDLDTTHFIKGPLSRAAHIGKNGVIDLGRVKSGLGITLTE
jgi:L-alanine-DL-glutamate epimerase-like enolase superfamily enzyme